MVAFNLDRACIVRVFVAFHDALYRTALQGLVNMSYMIQRSAVQAVLQVHYYIALNIECLK